MARVNLFDFTNAISNESVSNADVANVHVDGKKDLPKQVQEDTDKVAVDKDVSAESSNTKTSAPGPATGGGDGTAQFESAEKANTNMKIADVDPKVAHDQNGGRHIDTLPSKVNAKDNLSASDVRTSVEDHDDKSDSEESDLKTMDASGAEVVPDADDMVMDLESEVMEVSGLTDAADKGVSEADAAIAKSNDLAKAAASVERYIGLLDRIDQTGRVLSPELRRTISWALESIDAELFFHERVALESFDSKARVSMEANDLVPTSYGPKAKEGTIEDGEDAAQVSGSLKGKFKKIWEAAVRMFWRAVNAVVDAYHGYVDSMPKFRDHLAGLRGKVKVLDGGHEFQMKSAHRLMIGDEFVGDSREAIQKVSKAAQELLMTWPNQLGKLIKEWSDGRPGWINFGNAKSDAGNFAKLADNLAQLVERSFRGLSTLNSGDKDKVPSGFLNVTRLQWSGPMPGNRALYMGVNEDLDTINTANIRNSIPISFSAIPGYDTHSSGQIGVTTPSSGDAISIIRELEQLTHFIEDAKKGLSEIKKLGESAFGKSMEDIFGQGGQGPSEARMVGGMMMMGVIQGTTESQNQFFGYLGALIKSYIGFLNACLQAEGNGGKGDIEGEFSRAA